MSDDDYDSQFFTLLAIFEKAFSHPPTKVLSTIQANNLGACSEALATSLLSCAMKNPLSIDAFVQPLVGEILATEDLRYTNEVVGYKDIPFQTLFYINFSEYLKSQLHETQLHTPKQTEISPKNTVLSSALLAGSVVSNGLLGSTTIYSFAVQGLQFPGARIEETRQETTAIGACLILLVAGNTCLDGWMAEEDRSEKIITALEGLKTNKVIKYAPGVDLLEITIAAAKGGFAAPTPTAAAWKILFP